MRMFVARSVIGIYLVVTSSAGMAFEGQLNNAPTVRGDDPETIILGLSHGFRTKVSKDGEMAEHLPEQSFGARGANVGLSAEYLATERLGVRALSFPSATEYGVGVSARWVGAPVRVSAAVDMRAQYDLAKWRRAPYALATVDSGGAELGGAVLTASLGYDWYHRLAAAAIGAGYAFSDEQTLFGEYFPRFSPDRENSSIGEYEAWNVGWRWTRGGHDFYLFVSNSPAVDTRQAMCGSDSRDWNLGFKVTRVL